jgi:arylsulfatase A-like enzyme/Tfp pilus assembly protein PilF
MASMLDSRRDNQSRRTGTFFVCAAVLWSLLGCGSEEAIAPPDATPTPSTVGAAPAIAEKAPLPSGAAAGSNLVVITLDTTRADHLGCYGHPGNATPALDGLAAQGVRFAHAFAPTPMTSPSHVSAFTGLYPPAHGVRGNGEFVLAPEYTTAAELIGRSNYETAAFVSAVVLADRYGLDQGFEIYDFSAEGSVAPHGEGLSERPATAVTDAALGWLRERKGDRPFFLWVHFFDPHAPYAAPPEFMRRFPRDPYLAEIAYMDVEIGRLLQELEAAGAAKSSVVIVVGDHGESRGEHNEVFHSRTIYDGAVRVPFIVSAPGVVGHGRVVDGTAVSLADLTPTALDLLGLLDPNQPMPFDGRSLCGDPGGLDRIVYLETMGTYLQSGWAPLFGACRVGDKFIRAPRSEYYNLLADPKENRNLLADGGTPPEKARELERFLDDYLADKPGPRDAVASAVPMDAETRAHLVALGYVTEEPVERSLDDAPDPKDMLPLVHLYLEARNALSRGRLTEAEAGLRTLLDQSPRDRAALRLLGEVYLAQERYADAEEVFRARTEIRPDAVGLAFLAHALMFQNRFAETQKILDQATALDPENAAVLIARGDLMLIHRRPEEAIALYQHAARIDPARFGAWAEDRVREVRRLMATQQ